MKNITGQIWGIGVGPGDPDLMTLKAHRILQEADVVAFPAPAGSTAWSGQSPHRIFLETRKSS